MLPKDLGIDFEKILRFWVDYQGKYFYFETKPGIEDVLITVSTTERTGKQMIPDLEQMLAPITSSFQSKEYDVKEGKENLILGVKGFEKIIGKINKVPNFPPSLHLKDVTIKKMVWDYKNKKYITSGEEEKRDNYGLMLERLKYYEEIGDKKKLKEFLNSERF